MIVLWHGSLLVWIKMTYALPWKRYSADFQPQNGGWNDSSPLHLIAPSTRNTTLITGARLTHAPSMLWKETGGAVNNNGTDMHKAQDPRTHYQSRSDNTIERDWQTNNRDGDSLQIMLSSW